MRNTVVVLLLLFTGFSSRADNFEKHYGIGFVTVDIDSINSLPCWLQPERKVLWNEIVFTHDSAAVWDLKATFRGKPDSVFQQEFHPEIFYGSIEKRGLEFRCVKQKGNWAEVIVNNSTFRTAWVQLDKNCRFISHFDFYHTKSSLEFATDDKRVFVEQSERSAVIDLRGWLADGQNHERIQVVAIRGNRMQVEVVIYNSGMDEVYRCKGWITWRDNDKPLVTYNIMGC